MIEYFKDVQSCLHGIFVLLTGILFVITFGFTYMACFMLSFRDKYLRDQL